MGRKKRTAAHRASFMTSESRSIIAGVICLFFSVLLIFGTNDSSLGKFLIAHMKDLTGENFRASMGGFFLIMGLLLSTKKLTWNSARIAWILLYILSSTSLIERIYASEKLPIFDVYAPLQSVLGSIPAIVLITGSLALSLWLSLRLSYRALLEKVSDRLPSLSSVGEWAISVGKTISREIRPTERARQIDAEIEKLSPQKSPRLNFWGAKVPEKVASPALERKIKIESPLPPKSSKLPEKEKTSVMSGPESLDWSRFHLPTIDLLRTMEHTNVIDETEVRRRSLEIEKTLLQFNISVEMREAKVGPTVTQYRLKPAEGIKLSRIENLKKDLALALHAKSIRIQAPIPGIGLVGIEVPNAVRDSVSIREVLESSHFSRSKAPLSFAVGKDINGEYIVGDLAKMPHLLVAGQTASGKSVGVNGMLISLLYRHTPATLRMILIDPKRVEFELYDGIPHLLTPVINDPSKALNALKWCVGEMLRRYDELKSWKVRNLEEYNTKVDREDRMHFIVIVIDELADLMMSGNKKEVEHAITRLAQMARAVGMHIVVATQRPSVDVITGLIKANIPSRISFSLPTVVDSRTILDRMGAEDLLGRGDMLYSPVGTSEPERIQGIYVDTVEVEKVVHTLKEQVKHLPPDALYDLSISEGEKKGGEDAKAEFGDYEEDPAIIEEATRVVREAGKASTTMLQRRMQLGYARAARVIEILEQLGVVGPADGSKPRDVL